MRYVWTIPSQRGDPVAQLASLERLQEADPLLVPVMVALRGRVFVVRLARNKNARWLSGRITGTAESLYRVEARFVLPAAKRMWIWLYACFVASSVVTAFFDRSALALAFITVTSGLAWVRSSRQGQPRSEQALLQRVNSVLGNPALGM